MGIALNNDTDLSVLDPLMHHLDYVQCRGIAEIGRQGNSFDERVLDRVATLRGKYPELTISVDGSVNEETIKQLAEAGANRLVSGSAIIKSDDPAAAYQKLHELVN